MAAASCRNCRMFNPNASGPHGAAATMRSWRLIRYADGSSELYSARNDPNDWHNLLAKKNPGRFAGVIRKLESWLPEKEATLVADLAPDEGVQQE